MDNQKTILLVEDEQFIRELYEHALSQSGYQVTTTDNGSEVANLAKNNPHVILLDVMLPQSDGITILKQLKQDPSTSSIPVVMMTNTDDQSVIQQATTLGAASYLVKGNSTPLDVINKVQEILNASQSIPPSQPSITPPPPTPSQPATPAPSSLQPFDTALTSTPPAQEVTPTQPPTTPPPPTPSQPATPAKVLLIEDEDYIRDIYSRQLQLTQIQVDSFALGLEGLQAALHNDYDLLLLDIMLPDTNGLQILKEIKQSEQKRSLPVVLLTNLGQDVIIKEGFELGADGYLIKASLTPNQIVQEVKNILARKKSTPPTSSPS